METLGLKNINMLTKEQFDGVENPAADELYAVSSSGFGKPSSKYIDLTLGASGTQYTAPADGWFYAMGTFSSPGNFIKFAVSGVYASSITPGQSGNGDCHLVFPVRKGNGVRFTYSGTINTIRFIFDEGEQ